MPPPPDELDVAAQVAISLFNSLWPAIGYLVLFLIGTLFITVLMTTCLGFTFRACRVPSGWVSLIQIGVGLVLLYIGFSLSFSAIGIDVTGLFFNTGLFFAALTLSASDLVKDFFVGVQMHTFGVLDHHKEIDLPAIQIKGTLRAVGLFTSEIVELDADTSHEGHVHETVLIANRYLLQGPFGVTWKNGSGRSIPATTMRSSAAPSLPHSTRFDDDETISTMTPDRQDAARALLASMHPSQTLHQRRLPVVTSFGRRASAV